MTKHRRINPLGWFRNLRFRNKLFLSYLFVIVIPVAVLGWNAYGMAREQIIDKAAQAQGEAVRQLAGALNYKLDIYTNSIDFITGNARVKQVLINDKVDYYRIHIDFSQTIEPLFASVLHMNQEFISLRIYTENDVINRYTERIRPLSVLEEYGWYSLMNTGRQVAWLRDNEKLVAMRYIVLPYEKTATSLLVAEIDFDSFFGRDEGQFAQGHLFITDASGNAIYYQNNTGSADLGVANLGPASGIDGTAEISGVQYRSSTAALPSAGWNLTYLRQTDTMIHGVSSILAATISVIIICLLVLLVITRLLSGAFVARIERLNRAVKQAQAGDMEQIVSDDTTDEIGQLAGRFEEMLRNNSRLIADISQSRVVQKEAELKALQAQINPHFLYNTLSLINWRAIEYKAYDLSEFVGSVSTFYRTTLNRGENTCLVRDELQNVSSYIEIQLAMHKNSFDVECRIDEELLNLSVPNLIFQPIVENAIEHGIDQMRGGRGKLTLSGHLSGETAIFAIADNGPGIPAPLADEILHIGSKGYGLKNVHERIRIMYGSTFGINIESPAGRGATVFISLPAPPQSLS